MTTARPQTLRGVPAGSPDMLTRIAVPAVPPANGGGAGTGGRGKRRPRPAGRTRPSSLSGPVCAAQPDDGLAGTGCSRRGIARKHAVAGPAVRPHSTAGRAAPRPPATVGTPMLSSRPLMGGLAGLRDRLATAPSASAVHSLEGNEMKNYLKPSSSKEVRPVGPDSGAGLAMPEARRRRGDPVGGAQSDRYPECEVDDQSAADGVNP